MTALAVPLICSPLKDQAVQFAQQSYSHLADFYWSFFTGDMKRGGITTRGDGNESWTGAVWTHALRT